MDIRGTEVLFTPSEARWAQLTGIRFGAMPQLAQRILEARIERVRPFVPPEQLPRTNVDLARMDVLAQVTLNSTMDSLDEATLRYSIDAAGQEQPVIQVRMNRDEKEGLLALAQDNHEVAQEIVEAPEITAVEDQRLKDDFAMFVATSDVMEPNQAVALGDLQRNPELIAYSEAFQHEQAVNTLAITVQVITALEADLAG